MDIRSFFQKNSNPTASAAVTTAPASSSLSSSKNTNKNGRKTSTPNANVKDSSDTDVIMVDQNQDETSSHTHKTIVLDTSPYSSPTTRSKSRLSPEVRTTKTTTRIPSKRSPEKSLTKTTCTQPVFHLDEDDSHSVEEEEEKEKIHETARKRSIPKKEEDHTIPKHSAQKQSTTKTTTAPKSKVTTCTSSPVQKVAKTTIPTRFKPTHPIDSYPTSRATPGILSGYNFVFTGVLSSMGREEAEDYVKILGGKVTQAVSGKTHYLVCGEVLEDGRTVQEGAKYKKAMELGEEKVIVLDQGEKHLYALVQMLDRHFHKEKEELEEEKDFIMSHTTTTNVSSTPTDTVSPHLNPYAKAKTPPVNPYAKKATTVLSSIAEPTNKSTAAQNPYAKTITSTTTTATSTSSNPYAKTTSNPYTKTFSSSTKESNIYTGDSNNSLDKNLNRENHHQDDYTLWTDKYAPTSTQDILGNRECVTKLATWLNQWEDTFHTTSSSTKGGTKRKTSLGAPGGPFKAALLSGPPGIGKTTTAVLVAKEAGRQVLEWNASDTRSKKSLVENLGDVTGSQVLSFDSLHHNPTLKSHTTNRQSRGNHSYDSNMNMKRCIIMDEVDGMGAGDRSGMAELIKMIKNSKVPIICICNDRQSPKIRSLAAYCLDLKYRRPVKSVIARRALEIGSREGMRVELNAAEAIAESCGNDIRQVLNCLQMWSCKKDESLNHSTARDSHGMVVNMTYKDVKDRENFINKDEILRVSMFDATKLIIEGRRGLSNNGSVKKGTAEKDSLFMRSDAYFTDYSLMGLNVHQNYLKVLIAPFQDTKRRGDVNAESKCLERMFCSTNCMSDYAVAEHAVTSGDQQWGLLPFCSMLAVKTGFHAGGENGGMLPGFPEFAGWLGKNSSRGKKKRLLLELRHHMNYNISGDAVELRLCYLPSFRDHFTRFLLSSGENPLINETIKLMDEYGLDRDDLFENLDEFVLDPTSQKMESLDSKVKAAFTREYNKLSHKSQALVDEQGMTKTRSRKVSDDERENMMDEFGFDKNVDDDFGEGDDDDENEEPSAEIIQKLFKSSQKSKGKQKSDGMASGPSSKKQKK